MTPQAQSLLDIFRATGAYLTGHFILTSGLHSPEYLQCALVLQHPEHAEHLGKLLAGAIRKLAPQRIAVVAAPALGGLIIGHEVARVLGARFVFAERDASGRMALRRGFTVTAADTAVVVEDVLTTGGSTGEVVQLLQACDAKPLAAASIIDRSGGRADVGVPRAALVTLQVAAYPPDQCPLCAEGIPAVKPGSRPA